MQPKPLQPVRVDAKVGGMADDHLGDHRHHFLENLAALLDEQLVRQVPARQARRGSESRIVADVVRELSFEARA